MKKKILSLVSLICMVLLSSCDFFSSVERYYNELPEEMLIDYEELFDQEKDFYMVYCYSLKCEDCNSIKNWIIPYAEKHPDVPLYFANVTDILDEIGPNIPINASDASSTIGMDSIDDFYIYATPSLVGLDNHKVSFNIFGAKTVKSYLKHYK